MGVIRIRRTVRMFGTLIVRVGRQADLRVGDEVLEIAGGANILLDAHTSYAKVSLEEVLARNPEVIIDMGEMSQTIGVTARDRRRVVELWRRYPSLAAVRGKRVYAVASDIYVVPGPRVVEAARPAVLVPASSVATFTVTNNGNPTGNGASGGASTTSSPGSAAGGSGCGSGRPGRPRRACCDHASNRRIPGYPGDD